MDTFDITLASILTAGGVVATAALVTGLIGLLKRLPGLGTWVDGKNEPAVALLISAILVVLSFATLEEAARTAEAAFGAFLAWYGIARLSSGIHDEVKGLTNRT